MLRYIELSSYPESCQDWDPNSHFVRVLVAMRDCPGNTVGQNVLMRDGHAAALQAQ